MHYQTSPSLIVINLTILSPHIIYYILNYMGIYLEVLKRVCNWIWGTFEKIHCTFYWKHSYAFCKNLIHKGISITWFIELLFPNRLRAKSLLLLMNWWTKLQHIYITLTFAYVCMTSLWSSIDYDDLIFFFVDNLRQKEIKVCRLKDKQG